MVDLVPQRMYNRGMKKNNQVMSTLLAALATALLLSACGGNTPATTEAPVSTPAETQSIVITTVAPETTVPETTVPTTTAAPETTVPETTEAPTEAPTAPEPFGEEDMILTVDGTALSLRMDFAPVAGTLFGGAYDEQVGQACVGGGNDRAYYYEGDVYSIYTVGSASGAQTIYDIYIDRAEGYATAKGAVIGQTTRDEVLAIYGEPSFTSPAAERYNLGDFDLIFGFDGDILSSVGLHDNAVQ